jgi:formate dehydrogenase iron-sulfur subunit
MIACPFWVPKYEWDKRFPLVRKCDMCPDRQEAGMEPACATACTTGAIKFGEREELLQEAWARIKANPGKYIEHVYGEKEVGGTSILYIADVPFENLGFKTDLTTEALPKYTWKALSKIPYVLVGWGAILTAMYFYNKRRGDLESHDDQKAG